MPASPTVAETLEPYLDELRGQGKSDGTVRLYRSYLRRFIEACDSRTRTPTLVKSIDAGHTARALGRYKTNTARNTCLTVLRGWLRWCVRMGYMTSARAEAAIGETKHKRHVRKPKVYIPVERFPECLDVAGEWHPRSRAVIACALYTLGRGGELEAIQLKDVDLRSRSMEVYRAKRKRWTTVPMTPDFYDELVRWLSWYAEDQGYTSPHAMMDEHPDWYLIPRLVWVGGGGDTSGKHGCVNGRHIVQVGIQAHNLRHVVKRMLDDLKIEAREHGKSVRHLGEGVHTIRRSGARAMLDFLSETLGSDRALLQVSLMLDHEDTKTTLLYIGLDIERERLNDFLRAGSMYGVNPSRNAMARGTVTSITRPRAQATTPSDLPLGEVSGSD